MKASDPTTIQPSSTSATGSLESRASEPQRPAPTSIKEAAHEAKRAAGGAINQAKDKASHMVRDQQQSAADHIGRYGTALRDSAESVKDTDPNVAYFANRAAERIERIAEYVRETDVAGLRRDAEDIARRNPALFMGGMFFAGLILGGVVKTATHALREGSSSSGFDEDRLYDEPRGEPLGVAGNPPIGSF